MPSIKRLNLQPVDYDWLRPPESKPYLNAVERHYPQWRAFLWTSLRSGLRRGEVFALQWRDLDFEQRHIHVRHNVYRGKLEATKSHRKRVVPMSPHLHRVLEDHAAKTHRPGCKWVFPNADGQLARHLDHVERPHHGSLKAAGLRRIRVHDLRHTFASQLVLAGRPLKEVQELLGHACRPPRTDSRHIQPNSTAHDRDYGTVPKRSPQLPPPRAFITGSGGDHHIRDPNSAR